MIRIFQPNTNLHLRFLTRSSQGGSFSTGSSGSLGLSRIQESDFLTFIIGLFTPRAPVFFDVVRHSSLTLRTYITQFSTLLIFLLLKFDYNNLTRIDMFCIIPKLSRCRNTHAQPKCINVNRVLKTRLFINTLIQGVLSVF